MTEPQFVTLSALIIDHNGFLERIADALERLSDASEAPYPHPPAPEAQNTPESPIRHVQTPA